MVPSQTKISIEYNPLSHSGVFRLTSGVGASIWDRLKLRTLDEDPEAIITDSTIQTYWSNALGIIRDYGTRAQQKALSFRFEPQGEAINKIQKFSTDLKEVRVARDKLTNPLSEDQILEKLKSKGFTRRELKTFQLRDLRHLLSIPHGANFSVPGAGKTTVTFALHTLIHHQGLHLFVVGPKSSFPAWRSIVDECMSADAPNDGREPFTLLDGSAEEVERLLYSGATRFLMSYDLMVRQTPIISAYLSRHKVHLVLDESHRMKAGSASQRGAFLLKVSTLPLRRDILTGTPMPQSSEDLAAQLSFLWPGQGLDVAIQRGKAPKEVLGQLYVRTTKQELGLPPVKRHFLQYEMGRGQLALYGIVRHEALRQLTKLVNRSAGSTLDVVSARRSVMRLLQLSVNPVLALTSMASDLPGLNSGIVDQVLEEGISPKMQAVIEHARDIGKSGKKVVIWTIFTDSIRELERRLADTNPVTLYGEVPTGDERDFSTREGRLLRFHEDHACKVLIANPAAAGEGISLHTVCHDAIYLDRGYVSTHYLQSLDRIHRLGLPPSTETNVYIYRSIAPVGLGSIDYSVNRRLATKIRAMQKMLGDPDLHEIAQAEEDADDPTDYSVDLQDLVDLVEELEGKAHYDDTEDYT